MDINTINGVLRAIVPAAIAYAVGRGWLPGGTNAPDITAAVITLVAAIWSIHSNRNA